MTSGQIKLLTLLFALVNVWLLFHIPAVSEAILKFVSVGEIPGTNKSLSPDAMLYLAASSFVVAVVLIFWREFRKLFRRRKQVQALPAVAEAPAVPTSQAVVAAADSRRSAKKLAARPQTFVTLRRTLRAVRTSVRSRISKLRAILKEKLGIFRVLAGYILRRLAIKVRALIVRAWRWAVPRSKRLWALVVRFAKAARLLTIALWRKLEPHIRRFDRWLEVQLHRNQTTANALNVGTKTGTMMATNARKFSRFVKNARNSARNAWRTIDE